MNLFSKLQQRAANGKPLRVGLIGAGKFGSMYLAQVPRIRGVHLVGIADLSVANARANLARVGWPAAQSDAGSIDDAVGNATLLPSAPATQLPPWITASLHSSTASPSSM